VILTCGQTCRTRRVRLRNGPEGQVEPNRWLAQADRAPAPEDIVEDALAGYLEEVTAVRKTLDSRYDDLESGRVKPIDGEEAFTRLREESERRRSGG